jgi:hypothetical protein
VEGPQILVDGAQQPHDRCETHQQIEHEDDRCEEEEVAVEPSALREKCQSDERHGHQREERPDPREGLAVDQ